MRHPVSVESTHVLELCHTYMSARQPARVVRSVKTGALCDMTQRSLSVHPLNPTRSHAVFVVTSLSSVKGHHHRDRQGRFSPVASRFRPMTSGRRGDALHKASGAADDRPRPEVAGRPRKPRLVPHGARDEAWPRSGGGLNTGARRSGSRSGAVFRTAPGARVGADSRRKC